MSNETKNDSFVSENVQRLTLKISAALEGESRHDATSALILLFSFELSRMKEKEDEKGRKTAAMGFLTCAVKVAMDAGLTDDEFYRAILHENQIH